jgi:hypothetical protein
MWILFAGVKVLLYMTRGLHNVGLVLELEQISLTTTLEEVTTSSIRRADFGSHETARLNWIMLHDARYEC